MLQVSLKLSLCCTVAVKSIIAIGGFAQLCDMLVAEGFEGTSPAEAPRTDWAAKARHYHGVAKQYAATWAEQSAGGLFGGHLSAYNSNRTFSLKCK